MAQAKRDIDKVVIRAYPKIIFLYPIFVAGLACGLIQLFSNTPDTQSRLGLVFCLVGGLNLLVFSFEFSRIRTVAIIFGVAAVFFAFLALSSWAGIVEFFSSIVNWLELQLSTQCYFGIAIYFAIVYLGVYINTRFNYWEIKHNEILHYTGYLGDVKRYPSPNMKMTKEIDDVFEFLLLFSGKLVLFPASEQQAIVLQNVIGVNRIEKNLQELLSAISVELTNPKGND